MSVPTNYLHNPKKRNNFVIQQVKPFKYKIKFPVFETTTWNKNRPALKQSLLFSTCAVRSRYFSLFLHRLIWVAMLTPVFYINFSEHTTSNQSCCHGGESKIMLLWSKRVESLFYDARNQWWNSSILEILDCGILLYPIITPIFLTWVSIFPVITDDSFVFKIL